MYAANPTNSKNSNKQPERPFTETPQYDTKVATSRSVQHNIYVVLVLFVPATPHTVWTMFQSSMGGSCTSARIVIAREDDAMAVRLRQYSWWLRWSSISWSRSNGSSNSWALFGSSDATDLELIAVWYTQSEPGVTYSASVCCLTIGEFRFKALRIVNVWGFPVRCTSDTRHSQACDDLSPLGGDHSQHRWHSAPASTAWTKNDFAIDNRKRTGNLFFTSQKPEINSIYNFYTFSHTHIYPNAEGKCFGILD